MFGIGMALAPASSHCFQVRVIRGRQDGLECGGAQSGFVDLLHKFFSGDVLGQERLRQQHIFAEGVDHEALHAAGTERLVGEEGRYGIGHAGGADAIQRPGAGHQERDLAGFKQGVGGFIVEGVGHQAFCDGICHPGDCSDLAFAIQTDIVGIPGAIVVLAKDIAAKGSLDRQGIVQRIAGNGDGIL